MVGGPAPATNPTNPLYRAKKNPAGFPAGFWCKALAMTYSCMRMHTTIGAAAFHFRVREGIGWFHNAMVTRETVGGSRGVGLLARHTRTLSRSVLRKRLDVARLSIEV